MDGVDLHSLGGLMTKRSEDRGGRERERRRKTELKVVICVLLMGF